MPRRHMTPLYLSREDCFLAYRQKRLKPFCDRVRTFTRPLVLSGSPGAVLRKSGKEFGLGFVNLLLLVLVIGLLQPLLKRFLPSAGSLVLAPLVILFYWLGSLWIERRVPSELLPARALPETLMGLALGVGLFCALMTILWACGAYHPTGWGSGPHIAFAFTFTVLAGITEEIIFRGFLFRLFSKILGTWGALLLTAAFFGAAHARNPSATVRSSVAMAIEAGVLLGAAYALTNRLWFPIGLHIGWNFSEGSIFGMTISGFTMDAAILRGSVRGPALLTGGAFGPEASVVAVALCFAVAVFLLWRAVKFERIEPPIWRCPKPAQSITVETSH